MKIHGIHHVTAVTAKVGDNLSFYTQMLGLRLVKKTVNQDDVSAYHLFYADAKGTPGTDMTFFDWERAMPKQIGTDEISRTYFRVNGLATLEYWAQRLTDHGVHHGGIQPFNGTTGILFEDSEGQLLGLVDDKNKPFEGEPWSQNDIPEKHAVRGFHSVQLTVPEIAMIEPVFEVLGLQSVGETVESETGDRIRTYGMNGGGPGREVQVRELLANPIYGSTGGSVHHVAFRVKDEAELLQWIAQFERLGIPNSGLVDRFYFKSLYFRITRGILFELATDGPGFAADEDERHLGESLALPPFLESQRESIEAGLKPL